ncbi:MAG: O-antigen ligase family protein, partial [Lachnospiraceae bacterium]|nr:O-antigen ligase family protein [Lachnospiraceae bacterium]
MAKPLVEKLGVWMSRIWFILLGILLLIIAGAFIYANKNAASIAEDALLHKIVIADHWGSGRAEIWKEAIRLFGEGSLKDKLFGIGFNNISRFNLLAEILNGQTLADAHNVYLDMLLTCGILGAGLYFSTIIAMIVKAAKYAKECPGAILT